MPGRRKDLEEIRKAYARLMVSAGGVDDARLEQAFAEVPREAFLPPGPWHMSIEGRSFRTADADPRHVYRNALIALDIAHGINNGEPALHAAWMGAVSPQAGETVCHIGAGTGYYSAILSRLVQPGGRVEAFEIDENLARQAAVNLRPFKGVHVTACDATAQELPPCDVIYVNAGVNAPPPHWLDALTPGGRLIFPWRPAPHIGIALLATRHGTSFSAKPLMGSWFIPCEGASDSATCRKTPTSEEAWAVRSIWLTSRRAPDASAVAIYNSVWFSSKTELPET